MTGLTAWGGLLKIAALKSGDVVFVSGAAGAVGSVACQIAKLKGHTVIGSAGGVKKCAFLGNIGVDHVIDHKATDRGSIVNSKIRNHPRLEKSGSAETFASESKVIRERKQIPGWSYKGGVYAPPSR